jgi:hypothetical protein
MKKFYFLLLLAGVAATLSAQPVRYLEPTFSGVDVTANQTYGVNATVLFFSVFNQAVPEPLRMDVYEPANDTETNRPLVIYLHTGNFLPFRNPADPSQLGANGSCAGEKTDSSAVDACRRLAKMGYVATSIDYRLGWNALASSDVQRRFGIINAAYRGIQDLRTCIRYFKRSVAEQGNPWGVDTSKIIVWGQGTGGYIVLGATALDDYLKIPLASEGKFLYDHDADPATPPIPMVIPQVNGDINGLGYGQTQNPAAPNGLDTLNYPNHPGYTSDFQLAINMSGALADSSWVDAGQAPQISFHVPNDNFAPYGEGIVNVPGTNLQVVKVQGAHVIQGMIEQFGNNGAFIGQPIQDLGNEQVAAFAASPTNFFGQDFTPFRSALYPFIMPNNPAAPTTPTTTAPWEWSSFAGPGGQGCNTNKAIATPYIDTIFRFSIPRACFALGLQGCIDAVLSDNEPNAIAQHINVLAAPNPSTAQVTFSAEGHDIQSVQVYNRVGQLIREVRGIDAPSYVLLKDGFSTGQYIVRLNFKEGFVSKIIQFN